MLCQRRPAVRRGQRERGAAEPGLRGRRTSNRCCRARRSRSPTERFEIAHVRAQPPAGALLLRVDLFRQRGQHAGRAQRLSVAQAARAKNWPGWKPCRSMKTRSSCRCPTRAKRRPTRWPTSCKCQRVEGLIRNRYAGRTFIEGNDNRRAKGRDQIHAAARSARRQARAPGRRLDRPLDDDEGADQSHSRDGAAPSEIHVRVACPPIIAPCFYGIDMSTIDELFAPPFLHGRRS